MTYKYPFLTIMNDLHPAAKSLVLVGGWVPTVYFEYLWGDKREFFKTKDVDLALTASTPQEKSLLEAKIEKLSLNKRYHRKHLQLGKERPYQLIFGSNIPIDFLTDPTEAKKLRQTPLGRNILLNESEEYHFLLEAPISVQCDGLLIQVPQPARYIAHKIFVYLHNKDKRKKDLATAYYCLTRSPDPESLLAELSRLEATAVMKSIREHKRGLVGSKMSPAIQDIQKSLEPIGIYEEAGDIHQSLQNFLSGP